MDIHLTQDTQVMGMVVDMGIHPDPPTPSPNQCPTIHPLVDTAHPLVDTAHPLVDTIHHPLLPIIHHQHIHLIHNMQLDIVIHPHLTRGLMENEINYGLNYLLFKC